MDPALSKNGLRALRVFFYLVVAFLYAPIAILLLFSFNDSELPTFPLSGFTTEWYRQFATNPDLQAALKTSAVVAAHLERGRRLPRRTRVARARPPLPRLHSHVRTAPEPARDSVRRLRRLAAALLPLGRNRPGDQDGRRRAHRHQPPVHDPRARAAARADRREPRGGGARPRRRPPANVPVDRLPAHPPRDRGGVPHRVHGLVRRVRGRVVRRRHRSDVPDLPLRRPTLPEPPATGDRGRRRGDDPLAARRRRRRAGTAGRARLGA